MTYTKRAVALLLALMMVFTGAVQAFAATQMTMAVITSEIRRHKQRRLGPCRTLPHGWMGNNRNR